MAKVRAAAEEEQRPVDELVGEAVRCSLEGGGRGAKRKASSKRQARLSQLLMESLFAGAELDLERRKDYAHPIEL